MRPTWTFWTVGAAVYRKRVSFVRAVAWAAVAGPLLTGVTFIASLAAAPADSKQPSGATSENRATLAAPLAKLLELVVRQQFRDDFVDDDKWGGTRRVVIGHKIKGKPFEWRIRPTVADVKDGLWEKYAVRLVDPNERLHVEVTDLAWRGGRLAYTVQLAARMQGDARWERWQRGLKLLNAHVVAEATVDVQLSGEVQFKLLTGSEFPGMAVEPRFAALDIRLRDFDLERISKLDGIAAHELGDSLKPRLQRELNRREEKTVVKLNRSLEKQYDQLRFSPQAFVASGWSKLQDALK